MPDKKIAEILNELRKRILERYKDFKGLYLYGSMARGDYHKGSDIDVVAIFDEVDRQKDFDLGDIICELMYKYDIYIDLHIYTIDNLKKNPIYYDEVVNKGYFYGTAA